MYDFHSHGYENWHDGLGRSIDWNNNFFAFRKEDFDDGDFWEGVARDDEREISKFFKIVPNIANAFFFIF